MFAYIARSARRLLTLASAALLLTGAVACSDDSTAPSTRAAFSLQQVNGFDLPVTLLEGEAGEGEGEFGMKIDLLSGRLELLDDGTYRSTMKLRITIDDETQTGPQVSTGRYTKTPDGYAFKPDSKQLVPFTGAVADGFLTIVGDAGETGETVTLQYQKR